MSLNADWQLKIRDRVFKDIAKLPKKDKERIAEVIEKEISLNPYSGDIEK